MVRVDIGIKKLTPRIKKAFIDSCNGKCQNCLATQEQLKKDEKLNIHRITRETEGGTYCMNNCICLCSECHKRFHEGEKMGRK